MTMSLGWPEREQHTHLWRSIEGCALAEVADMGLERINGGAKPEVGDFGDEPERSAAVAFDQDILRLEIPMDNVLAVKVLHTSGDINQRLHDSRLWITQSEYKGGKAC